MRAIKLLLVAALCSVAPACATTAGRAAANQREATTVLVQNQAVLDMNVYILRGSERIRLGTATGLRDTRFTIPRGIIFGATSLRFIADPIGGNRSPISEEITVQEGEEVVLRIPSY
jgi:hypothetical protein